METLNTKNLNEILRERYSNWDEDIDGKIKKDYEHFMVFCKVVGIDPNNLKSEDKGHRYKFNEENQKFICDVLNRYSDSDIANLRKGNYSDVSKNTYDKIKKFIISAMKDCNASPEKIELQLTHFHNKTLYIYEDTITHMRQIFEFKVNSYFDSVLGARLPINEDRRVFLKRL